MVQTYRSFGASRWARLGHLVDAAIWGFLPAAALVGAVIQRNPALFLGAAVFAAVWMWPVYTDLFRRAYEIRLWNTGRLEFEAPLRTFRLGAHELVSIALATWAVNDQAYLVVRHGGGKFWVAWPLHDFADFLDRLQALNPILKIEDPEELAPELPEKRTATTREVIRQSPIGALFVLAMVGAVCYATLHDHLGPVGAIGAGVAIWLALMFGVGRGWVTFDGD